jgi:hypothetical protein
VQKEIAKKSALPLMFAAVMQLADILPKTFTNIRVFSNYLIESFTYHPIILLITPD